MAFVFRLERILNLRLSEQDDAARINALAQKRLQEARFALLRLETELESTQHLLDEAKRSNMLDAKVLHFHGLRCAGLELDIGCAELEVLAANEEAIETSRKLTEAHKAVEILQKLRERDEDAWNRGVKRKEKLFIDEVAVTRHRMKEV